jgi:predicted amidohydrolase
MTRLVTLGAAQLGPIQRDHSRKDVVERLIDLLRHGAEHGCDLVVFPELALTTFFPRWYITDEAELDEWYETAMPGPETQVLFDEAARLGVGFSLGYAELKVDEATGEKHRYNCQVLVERDGSRVGIYRKVHLPGHDENEPWRRFQHLEKRYFEPGPDGFGVWRAYGGIVGMAICNDRRWPETYRVMGLQGAELILIGYNTPVHNPPAPEHDRLGDFHNHLVMQSGAYQNGTWVVGVAKAGDEEGIAMIGGSAIIAPTGEIVGRCVTEGDELAVAIADLDLCTSYKGSVFDFAKHRQPWAYGRITDQAGAILPPE